MLTEFGGVALSQSQTGTWGYSVCSTPEEFARQYERLLEVVRNLGLFAGFCYTQFADTYQEANGLLHADRTPKVPIDRIARATRGRGAVRNDGLSQIQNMAESGEAR
jgi:hypothetical protein